MNTAIIIVLSAVVLYLGRRWLGARAQVSELLAQNAVLKRRVARIAR